MRRNTALDMSYLKALFYGVPGSTKTRTAGTAALDERTSPCLMLAAAANEVAIRDYPKRPDIIQIDSLADFNPIFNWLASGQPADVPGPLAAMDLRPPYKSLLIDSITEVQRISFNIQTGSTNIGPGSFPSKVERQHFGAVLSQMVNFAKLFYSLPMHVIITCQEKAEKDEQTGAISMAPLLWGQSDVEVGSYAYLVARLVHRAVLPNNVLRTVEDAAQGDVTSVAFFTPSGKYVAKDQYGRLGNYMTNPTIPKILDMIYGG